MIEAVGADQTINDAILCAAPGGTISEAREDGVLKVLLDPSA